MAEKNTPAKPENVIVDRLREKLRKDIADLIPEETLDELIKTEVDKFERVEIPKIIKENVSNYFKDKLATLSQSVVDEYCGKSWTEEKRAEELKLKPNYRSLFYRMLRMFYPK